MARIFGERTKQVKRKKAIKKVNWRINQQQSEDHNKKENNDSDEIQVEMKFSLFFIIGRLPTDTED